MLNKFGVGSVIVMRQYRIKKLDLTQERTSLFECWYMKPYNGEQYNSDEFFELVVH